jgi:glyoxylase-like metal-dependent hydrolase (beta-lactamase superfamily II)
MGLVFDRSFDPRHGEVVPVAPGVVRVTAENPGPFTFHGTNSYIVGHDTLAVIDPGPDDDRHFEALRAAIGGRPVSHVLVTHTHRDHSPLARRLAEATGALTVAEGPHRAARPLPPGQAQALDASGDTAFVPDLRLADGDAVDGDGWRLSAVHTPGHAANHHAYALGGSGILFCGDHVMGWSTSIVAPPDGAMGDYMASLDRLIARGDPVLLPGHGGPVDDPATYLPALREHRMERERGIVARLRAGDRHIPQIVSALYVGLEPQLHVAAGLSVLAHLEDLVGRGEAACEGVPTPDASFTPA